ncbi:hypothetical protein GCM10022423_46960 [Flavobacterium ginsengiterrae]|uniref:Uncharacterized protein n=1 Tax=Flavobacterium ginsengiterrae TaxID=871695 RepID=A0ABP7H699_9FLAO
MKKILSIGCLMFFVHFFILLVFFTRLNVYVPKHYESNDHGIYSIITLFFSFIIYIVSIILVLVEYKMKIGYKWIMLFLMYSNCLLEFYINTFYQFQLFTRPERYNISAIIIILIYFAFELVLTYYVIIKLYKTNEIEK